NAWDGSLTIDEENGTIMSTMLGAGYKDGENRYNGVLIGDVRHAADGAAGTGIYGYHEGVQSFGLNIDGTAFMGKSGQGQIQFDGNSGTIQSMSFKTNGTGMKIDLDDGYIDIGGSKITSVKTPGNITITAAYDSLLAKRNQNISEIDTLTAKFLNTNLENINGDMRTLAAAKDKTIARLTNQNNAINAIISLYGNNTTFTYDDLNKNENVANILKNNNISGLSMLFTGTDFFPQYTTTNSKVKIASFDPYLSIISANEEGNKTLIKQNVELLHIGDDKYFLQTNDFPEKYVMENDQYIYDEQGNKVKVNSGVKIDLANGKITAYDFEILAKNPWGRYKDSYIRLNSDGNPYFRVHYKDDQSPITNVKEGNGIDLINVSNTAFIIQSQTWGKDEHNVDHGIQLNLTKGTFRAFDSFNLKAVATNDPIIKPDITQGETTENTGLDPATDRFFGSSIQLSSSGQPFLKIHLADHNANDGVSALVNKIYSKETPYHELTTSDVMENTLMEVSASNFILRSQDWNYTRQTQDKNGNTTYTKRGIEFNLQRGKITAYGFTLDARKSDDFDKRIRINTDATDYPFRVDGYDSDHPSEERYTRISWDGSLITNYIKADLGGKIGPFTINNSALYTGSSSLGGSGVYLGTAGISVGSGKFKVDSDGDATIYGTTTIGGTTLIKDDVTINGHLVVKGTVDWQGKGSMSNGGSLGGGSGGTGGTGFGLGSGGAGLMQAGNAEFANITVSDSAKFTENCQVHITGKVGINASPSSSWDLYVAGNTTIGGKTEIIGETHIYGQLYAGSYSTYGNNNSPVIVEIDTPWSGSTGKLTFRNGLLTGGENVTMTKPSGYGGYVINKSGHPDGSKAGELCYKDNVEISKAVFKIGSSTLTGVGNPTISGDTATYTVTIPAQAGTNKTYYEKHGTHTKVTGSTTHYIYSDGNVSIKTSGTAPSGYSYKGSYTTHSTSSEDSYRSVSVEVASNSSRTLTAAITVKAT
ncbi:MAG: hypothetical protein J6W64_05175, partial [Bacilli bacterium]|nr:hypothetical protein [Bacilli bacterium]